MKDRYVFPALLDYGDDGISVSFPDLLGAFTCGDSEEEALRMAKECLTLHLFGLEEDGDDIPEPSKPRDLSLEPSQFPVVIDVWMPPFRENMRNKAVKKTLTIPKWLNDEAEREGVNFSHLLQDALKDHLGISNGK